MDVKLESLPSEEAIRYLRSKTNITTAHWDDLLREIHAKVFAVAGATKLALVQDLRAAVQAALEQGESIGQFRKRFDQIVQEHGWEYKGQRGWRTRVIYDTNLRTARMAGKWEQFQRTKKTRPYAKYVTSGDSHVRPEHRKWDGLILHKDDPFWNTHWPPNDYGCRCDMVDLSERDLIRKGLTVSEPPKIVYTERINSRTGEVYGNVPEGIGVGWDYNVGQVWLAPEDTLGKLLVAQPLQIAQQTDALIKTSSSKLQEAFKSWLAKVLARDYTARHATVVGYLFNTVVQALRSINKPPVTASILLDQNQLRHLMRDAKDTKQLPAEVIANIPQLLGSPQAIVIELATGDVVYLLDSQVDTGYKLFVKVNFSRKGEQFNSVRSGGIIPVSALRNQGLYQLVWGEL